MGRTRERFFKNNKPVEVKKVFRIDEFTKIYKLDNGVEYVEEDYTKAMSERIAMPQKVRRTLHPGGRQDCNIKMGGPTRAGAKNKTGV